MNPHVLTVLLVIANVAGAGMIVPQVVRLHRTRRTDGLSPAWVGVGIVLNTWWLGYALSQSLYGLVPVSVGALVLYLGIGAQLRWIDGPGSLAGVARGSVVPVVGPLPFLAAGGWQGAGVAIGCAYAIQFSPAAWTAVRSAVVDGISPITWSLALLEAAIWLAYAIDAGDTALLIGGTGGSALSLVILGRLALESTRRRPARLAL